MPGLANTYEYYRMLFPCILDLSVLAVDLNTPRVEMTTSFFGWILRPRNHGQHFLRFVVRSPSKARSLVAAFLWGPMVVARSCCLFKTVKPSSQSVSKVPYDVFLFFFVLFSASNSFPVRTSWKWWHLQGRCTKPAL